MSVEHGFEVNLIKTIKILCHGCFSPSNLSCILCSFSKGNMTQKKLSVCIFGVGGGWAQLVRPVFCLLKLCRPWVDVSPSTRASSIVVCCVKLAATDGDHGPALPEVLSSFSSEPPYPPTPGQVLLSLLHPLYKS